MGGHSPNRDEMLLHFILLLSAILAMASFYFTSSYSTMLWIYFVSVVGGLVIAVPDYAYFNRSPMRWTQPLGNEAAATQSMARMKRAHSFQRQAASSSEDAPFPLSSIPRFPTSAMCGASSGGGR